MLSFKARCASLLMLSALVTLAGTQAHAGSAHLILNSDPGSFIGDGVYHEIIDDNALSYSVFPFLNLPDGRLTNVGFNLHQSNTVYATLFFSTHILDIPLQTGVYNDAQRFPFEKPGHAGLDVTYYFQGSNELTGSFTITDFTFYKDYRGLYQVATFAATFDQVSDNATSHVYGSLTYDAGVIPAVPEPSSIVLCGISALIGLGAVRTHRRRPV